MKKKLISLAVAGALVTPIVASAQGTNVTIFGRGQAEYSHIDPAGVSSQSSIGDQTGSSRFGLQVNENLGGGLKAKARIEYGLNTGTSSIGNARERWVALANDSWGEVKFGRVQSPFKDFAGGMTIDPFAYTTLQANGSGGTMTGSANGLGSGASSFVNSAARYDSPKVEGFAFSGLLMPGDANTLDPIAYSGNGFSSSNTNSGGENGEWDFQVAGKYDAKISDHNLGVFGGYSRDNVSTQQKATYAGLNDEQVWRGGATWAYQNFKLNGQYENINNAVGAATCSDGAALGAPGDPRAQCNSAMNLGGDGSLWFVGGSYDIGNTSLVAQGGMGNAKAIGSAEKRDVSTFTVGTIHHLSKRSSLFGGYQRTMMDAKDPASIYQDANKYTVGMRHNF